MRDWTVAGATFFLVVGLLVLLVKLVAVAFPGAPPCRPMVRDLEEHGIGSCWHPHHTATITTEHGPVLLVCSCPEVTP